MTFQTTRRSWTKNEINILKKMFANNYTIDVCDKLNRSYSSINGMAHTLGLKKSSAFMKMELKRQADRIKIIGVKTRFKKGREPDNKGRKQVEYMSNEGIEKSAKMRFKKGNLPHNAKSVGDEVTRTYKGGKQYLMLKVAVSDDIEDCPNIAYEQGFVPVLGFEKQMLNNLIQLI